MSIEVAEWIVFAARTYLALGAAFAVVFSLFLVTRIDPAAKVSSWGFRLVILPGSVLLWPWLLVRVLRGGPPREERSAHRACAAACPRKEPTGNA